ncbi:MAG: phage portal protein, partial [Alphaproteobacteria bacterium]
MGGENLTVFERIMAAVSPSLALKRYAARQLLGAATRGYEAARPPRGRPLSSGLSGNAELRPALRRLRDAAADLMMNDPWAKKATRELVSAHVGTGVIPTPVTDSERMNAKLMAYWRQWISEADFDGRTTAYGLQSLVVGSAVQRGNNVGSGRSR